MDKKPRILVIGSINMDLLLQTPRLPSPGETLLSQEYSFGPGGKGANQAVACAMLGAETTFVCKIGNDAFGSQLRQSLKSKGVVTDYVAASKESKSGFAVILLEEGGNNRIIVHLASNLDLSREDIDRAFDNDYDGMIIQFELAQDIVVYACGLAKKKGIPFIVDAGPAINFPLEEIQGMEILSPNETETAALCGIFPVSEADCERAAKALTQRSQAKHVVLKMGEKGAFHYSAGMSKHYPAHDVKAVDATAAGDVFTAAMAIQYLRHGDMDNAIRYATAAGALTVTKAGAQESVPCAKDVERFLQ